MPSPTQIEGKYEILEKLHEGGMGAIYKVRHLLLGGIRVVKVIRPQLGGATEFKERFLREAKIAFRLPHRNIAQLFDFSVDEQGVAYIVMEYIDGVNLEEVIERPGAAGLPLALEITHQALAALSQLHRKGFIHRDISPDNLMLTRDEEHRPLVKLIDLGIAKELGSESNLTRAGAFVGKLKYCPPERLKSEGDAAVDERSDLYAFGIVLYELLTGTHPIQGRDTASIVGGHLFRDPVPFDQSDPEGKVPEGLRAIVLRSLEKKPVDRFQNAREFSDAIAPFRQQFPVSARDMDRALNASPPTIRMKVQKPGSTQNRLDAQFGAQATTPNGRTPGQQPTTASAPPAADAPSSTMVAPLPGKKQRGAAVTPPPLPGEEPGAAASEADTPQSTVADDRGVQRQEQVLERDIRELHARGEVSSARKNLEILRAIAPDSAQVAELDQMLNPPEPTPEQQAAAAAEEIQAALDRWDVAEAEQLLASAKAQFAAFGWTELQEKVDEIRRGEAISAEAGRINELIAAGNLSEATAALDDACSNYGPVELFRLAQLRLDEANQEREASIAAAFNEVSSLLEDDQLDAAETALTRLAEEHSDRSELASLREQLGDARSRARLVAELAAARQALDGDDPATAMIRIDQALALDDGSTEALQLRDTARERLSAREQQERQARVDATVRDIAALIESDELSAARERLESAAVAEPDVAEWKELADQLSSAEALAEQRQQAQQLIAEARSQLDDGHHEAALERAREAAQLAPDDPTIQQLIAEATAAANAASKAAEDAERRQQLETAVEQARAAMAAGRFDDAASQLDSIEASLGTGPLLETVRSELDAARQEAETRAQQEGEEQRQRELAERRQRQISEVTAAVESSLDEGDIDRAAAQLEDAEAVLGEIPEAAQLRQRIAAERQRREDEKALTASCTAIETALTAGDLAAARQQLESAPRTADAEQQLSPLRQQLQAAEAEHHAEQERTLAEARDLMAHGDLEGAASTLATISARPDAAALLKEIDEQRVRQQRAEKVAALQAEAAERRSQGRLDDAVRLLEEALSIDAAAHEARATIDEIRQEMAERERAHARTEAVKRIEPLIAAGKVAKATKLLKKTVAKWGDGDELAPVRSAIEAAAAREPAEEPAPAEDTATARPKWLIPAVVIVVAVIVAATVWLLTRGEPTPVVPGEGQIIVDAVPWGEVTEIVRDDGSAVSLPEESFTPLSLQIPAGTYTLTVRQPETNDTATQTLEITAGETATAWMELQPRDVDQLLERLGVPENLR